MAGDAGNGRGWLPDAVIAVGLLAVFGYGLVEALAFPFRAGLVPRIICCLGIGLSLIFVARITVSGRQREAVVHAGTVDGQEAGDEDGTSEDYAFASASREAWIGALAWFTAFFVIMWLVGALVAVPIFAVAYLVLVGQVRLVWALVYAAASWMLLYLVFYQVLELSLPGGLLW